MSKVDFLCPKFDFGVPLEDLFPPNYIHPKLELMYSHSLKSFKKNNITAEMILTKNNETRQEKLKLKKMMLDDNYLEAATPQSLLWLIEHFLGMLPIPLLPSYSNGEHFKWLYLSTRCKEVFQIYHKERYINYEWDYDISSEFLKLPFQHYLLLNLHMNFMHQISFRSKKRRLTKRNIIYYTKYFTSSIFLRPFRPGLQQDVEKDYHFLLLYMLLRWPFIQEMNKYSRISASLSTILEVSESDNRGESRDSLQMNNNQSSTKKYRNQDKKHAFETRKCCCSIGSNYTAIEKKRKTNSVCMLYQNKFPCKSQSTMTEHSDQIEYAENNAYKQRNDSKKLRKIEESNDELKSSSESFIYDDYDTFKTEEFNQISDDYTIKKKVSRKRVNNSRSKESKLDKKEHEAKPEEVRSNLVIEKNNHTTEQTAEKNNTEGEIVGDREFVKKKKFPDKIEHNKQETSISNKASTATNGTEEHFPENKNPINIDTDILKRVTKLGWTYTPPKVNRTQERKISDDLLDNEITTEKLIDNDSHSESNLKKYPSVKSLKSKLSFFKIGKKNSHHKTEKEFKYVKINS